MGHNLDPTCQPLIALGNNKTIIEAFPLNNVYCLCGELQASNV